ncbi:MAG TPA: NAD-dependent epimerase/dehydratase family protein [Thermoleophilaceae bacterium]|nr:NAD-dependent epimerase/dehydratase family protein [Thermoleophilaceae bacterium]
MAELSHQRPTEAPSRVFLTGALGFIGRAIADRYAAEGVEVRGVDVNADPARDVVAGDVREPGAWQRHAEGCDVVIHLAAILGFGGRHEDFWRINVVGTRNVLDAAVATGATRFVHTSSIVVFGDSFTGTVDERTPVRLTGRPYTDTKIASEQVVLQAHAAGELACTIVRPGDVYGPGSRPWVVLPLEAIRRRQVVLPAGGRGVLSPVYVDDLVDGYLRAASEPAALGQVITLTGPEPVETREFLRHHFDWLGMRGPTVVPTPLAIGMAAVADAFYRLRGKPSEANPGAVRYMTRRGTISIDRARELLGYEPRVGLDEGMRRSREWAQAAGLLG